LDKTIARHADVEVVLISDENFTLFTPLLHEVAAEIFIQATLSIPSAVFFVTSWLSKRRRKQST
jgi:NADH dehydrogenase FAD-containing subunit